MDCNFLKELDIYFRENNFTFPAFYFPVERFPHYFIRSINEEMSKYSDHLSIDKFCEFKYDNNGVLSLIFKYNNGKTSAVIIDNSKTFLSFDNSSFKFTKLSLNDLIEKTSKIELKYKLYNDFKDELNYLSEVERIKVANRISDKIIKDYNVSSMVDNSKILLSFNNLLNVIKDYASYINEEYLIATKEEKRKEVIYFEPHDNIKPITKGSRKNTINKLSQERKNEIIPIENRLDVLNGLGPVDYIQAKSMSNDDEYYCFLYPMGNNEYKLIAEPISGERYTRIYHFISNESNKTKILENAIINYLPLSDSETLSSNFCFRLGHTSLATYISSISYAIKLDDIFKAKSYVKENVKTTTPNNLVINDDSITLH